MEQQYIKKWTEKKGNPATTAIETRTVEAGTIKPEAATLGDFMGTSEEYNSQKGYTAFAFLIFLVIGMLLQLTGNAYCILSGTLVCVSVFGSVCIWICVSAVFSENESDSLP
jgi:hypothetical protein